jgi:chemotaxis protein MotB
MNLNSRIFSNENTNRWIISYADFVTLLLALFIVLYAFSLSSSKNFNDMAGSLSKTFEKKVNKSQSVNNGKIDLLEQKRLLLRIFETSEVNLI